jgi:hypothetical protein
VVPRRRDNGRVRTSSTGISAYGPRAVRLGLLLGAGFGLWNLLVTRSNPLLEDTPIALLAFYGPMLGCWGLAGFTAARRSGRLWDGVKVGAMVALVTFIVFNLAAIARVNLFLDTISQRADWQNLILRFRASSFESLRAYANYEYLTGVPLMILVASVIGGVTGLIGGLLGIVGRRLRRA